MVLVIGYHATGRSNRASIQAQGLIAGSPSEWMPCGVYVFSPGFQTPALQRVMWWHRRPQDLWRVAYCGPIQADPYVENGLILPSVPVVTLVTGNE